MRLGRLRIRTRDVAHERQHCALVGLLCEEPVELHEHVADTGARQRRVGKHALDARAKLVVGRAARYALAVVGRERGEHTLRPLGGGIDIRPQLRGVLDEGALAARDRDFGGAARKTRIARIARGINIGACRDVGVTALQRDVAEQQPVEQLRGKTRALRGGGRFRSVGLRLGFRGLRERLPRTCEQEDGKKGA